MIKKNKILYNKYSREDLKKKLDQENYNRITISFYKYVTIKDPVTIRQRLYIEWDQLNIKGRIYIAQEGINAQLSCPEPNWAAFKKHVNTIPELKNVPFKIAVEGNNYSFLKLAIKVKKQIVADGLNNNEYDVTNVGTRLTAKQWNEYIDEGATVVDVRNHYESRIGHFENAICPDVDTFREELPIIKDKLKSKKKDKILLYCTGGIRCEKTSAYLKHHGFKDVNQLHGGIIEYAKQVKETNIPNKFIGKNFVFDDRISERISEDVISNCHQCGKPCDEHANCENVHCNLLFIQCDDCKNKNQGCCSKDCIEVNSLPEDQQKKLRSGKENKKMFHSHKKVDLRNKI